MESSGFKQWLTEVDHASDKKALSDRIAKLRDKITKSGISGDHHLVKKIDDLHKKVSSLGESNNLSEFTIVLNEIATSGNTRYSINVDFRTDIRTTLAGYCKIVLGYVSAVMKQRGYHIKHVFEQEPYRVMVSSRNWDDGEFAGLISFNPNHEGGSFIISTGFYNRERRTINIQNSKKATGNNAADLSTELLNMMHELKGKPDRYQSNLKPVPLKRGPK